MPLIPTDLLDIFPNKSLSRANSLFYNSANRYPLGDKQDFRISAVAIVLYKKSDCIYGILTQRPVYDGPHSGQISFPGGKFENFDSTTEMTARRECFEEIGIPQYSGKTVGQLDPVYIPISNFLIHPYIIYHEEQPTINQNYFEVSEILHFDIQTICSEENKTLKDIVLPERTIKNTPVFKIHENEVWGATATILEDLRRIIEVI
jgi:8-oxo-dGTP pyrophosphatase MutT (NUDIX family)